MKRLLPTIRSRGRPFGRDVWGIGLWTSMGAQDAAEGNSYRRQAVPFYVSLKGEGVRLNIPKPVEMCEMISPSTLTLF